ncbi:unnamed protein product [Gordionus sp. m RMFG-2023]
MRTLNDICLKIKFKFHNKCLSTLCLKEISDADNNIKQLPCSNSCEAENITSKVKLEENILLPNIRYIEINSKSVADDISNILVPHICKKSRFYEINSGKGLITGFLNKKIKLDINILEGRKSYYQRHQKKTNHFQYKNYIKSFNLLNFFDLNEMPAFKAHKQEYWTTNDQIIPLYTDNTLTKPYNLFTKHGKNTNEWKNFISQWKQNPKIQMFSIMPFKYEAGFLHNAILQLQYPNNDSLYSHGRIQFLFYISGREATYMRTAMYDKPPYRSFWYNYASVSYKMFYDIEFLDKRPLGDFYPDLSPLLLTKKRPKFDYSHMYLVKMTPKKSLYDDWDHESLTFFMSFLRQLLRKPAGNDIKSFFVKWMGANQYKRFLEKNVNTPSTIKLFQREKPNELTPEELVELFNLFQTCSEYANCFAPMVSLVTSKGYNRMEYNKTNLTDKTINTTIIDGIPKDFYKFKTHNINTHQNNSGLHSQSYDDHKIKVVLQDRLSNKDIEIDGKDLLGKIDNDNAKIINLM